MAKEETNYVDKSDARIKRLMEQVGMPNSMSLYQAFKQLENEIQQEHLAEPPKTEVKVVGRLNKKDVKWVVNSIAELGVRIGDQCFFLYKGESLTYENPSEDDEPRELFIRTVGKREFGETCNPIHPDMSKCGYKHLKGTVSLEDCDRWEPMPSFVTPEPADESQPCIVCGAVAKREREFRHDALEYLQERDLPTNRRMAAVQYLLEQGCKWDSKQWVNAVSVPSAYGRIPLNKFGDPIIDEDVVRAVSDASDQYLRDNQSKLGHLCACVSAAVKQMMEQDQFA